jgi:uncharacterized membrane protein YhaH (DUF805 family)
MQITNLLLSFQGRIPRQTFWLGILGALGIFLVVCGIVSEFDGPDGKSPYDGILAVILLPYLWVSLAIQVKRWHDRGHSGWRVLINLIPIIGWIWVLVELGFRKGATGGNQYGADPLPVAG